MRKQKKSAAIIVAWRARYFPVVITGFCLFTKFARAAEGLSFDDALQLVTGDSIAVKKADAVLAIANARNDQSRYVLLPDLNAKLKAARSDTDFSVQTTEKTLGLEAGWNLFRFGGDRARQEAAAATAAAASEDRVAAVTANERAAVDALLAVIQLSKQRAIEQEILQARQGNLAMAQRLYAKGVRPTQDVEKVAIDTAVESSRLADTELQLNRAKADLCSLAGRQIEVRAEWPWSKTMQEKTRPSLDLATPKLTELPERQALVQKLTAINAGLTDYQARRLPSLDLTLGYEYTAATQNDYPDTRGHEWTGALVLSVPLFDRFATRTDHTEQLHQRSLVELDLAAKDRTLQSEWTEAQTGFKAALASATALNQTVDRARKLYEHSLKSFQSGLLSADDLSVDEGRLYDTELSELKAWATAHRYYSRLCYGLGKKLRDCE